MNEAGIYKARVARLFASGRVVAQKPPRDVAWPIAYSEPPDLAVLYAAADGLALDDGLVLFGKGELADVTLWLVLEKGLSWPDGLVVIGERRDTIVVLDLDPRDERAGGGVLEVGADDLGAFERVACDVTSYALVRAHADVGLVPPLAEPPEVAARRAAEREDLAGLERELGRPFYPGHERLVAALALELGALHARAGHLERALAAFERSVESRAGAVGMGARTSERAAGWRAAAHAARAAGAADLAGECERRAR
jgi:hypothetical protein